MMKLLKNTLRISFLICVVIVALISIFSNRGLQEITDVKMWGTYFFYSFVLTLINSLYFTGFAKKFGWRKAGLKKVLAAATGSIILTLGGYFFCRMIDETLFSRSTFEEFIQNEKLEYYFLPLLFTAIVSLIFHLIYFYKALQDEKVTEQKIIAGTASAKFESLKNQIDPHFLFNSLNVLTSLIDENPGQAQKFTTSLSKIYRYVLEQKDKELVSLEEELDFAVTYMNLLKMRFENSIFYEVPAQLSSPEAKVVPLSLQLLLENTVKHNVLSESRPLRIKIYEADGYLVVENNFQKKEVLHKRQGVGLQNIVARYALLTRRKVIVAQDTDKFMVKLPVLTKQIYIMETNQIKEQNAYEKARKRVQELKKFYGSLLSYCIVIPILAYVNYISSWEFQWFWFPMLGWGIALAFRGFSVLGYGDDWEERKIQEILKKEQQKTWK